MTGIILFVSSAGFTQLTCDTLATKKTQCTLEFFYSLNSNSDNRVVSGLWMNYRGLPETPATEFDSSVTVLYNQTNEKIGMLGTSYMREHTAPYYHAIENLYPVNQSLIDYSQQGGIPVVMPSFKNPWTGNNANDLTGSDNLLDIVTPGHLANINFTEQLDSVAKGFQQLEDSNVTVLFRPFHEMNGYWFWWGSKSATLPVASDYVALWNFTYDYMTNVKGLHNILWYFTPSAKGSGVGNPSFKSELFYYPGDSLVDIIGLDIYLDSLDIPNYNSIIATGKPVGIAEYGPDKNTAQSGAFTFDYTILINQIKQKYPELNHWLSWNHFYTMGQWNYYSMSTQLNADQLLSDTWVMNLDEINMDGCLYAGLEPDKSDLDKFTIYPNPAINSFSIQANRELMNAILIIADQLGQIVHSENNLTGNVFEFNIKLNPGMYYVILNSNSEQTVQKLIISQ